MTTTRRSFIKKLSLGGFAIISSCNKYEEDDPAGNLPDRSGTYPVPFRNITWEDIYNQQVHDHYSEQFNNEEDYANRVYIDPEYQGETSSGTIENPLKSLADVSFDTDTAYLIKRGTEHNLARNRITTADNIMIGAYGSGSRPVITGSNIETASGNVTIRDLVVSAIRLGQYGGPHPDRNFVFNCILNGSGELAVLASNVKVIGCEITNNNRNGVYVRTMDRVIPQGDVEIGYCYIHNINQIWHPGGKPQTEASGDGIQITSFAGNYHVHHNLIDRHDTGNKFNIIAVGANNGDRPIKGIIENNFLIGGLMHPNEQNVIYIGNISTAGAVNHHFTIIRNNVLIGVYDSVTDRYTGCGVYCLGSEMHVYGNLFMDLEYGMRSGFFGKNFVYNNTFVKMRTDHGIVWDNVHSLYNNIFDRRQHSSATNSGGNLYLTDAQTSPGKLFRDHLDEDYRLRTDSPAISAGTWADIMSSDWKKDLMGTSVPHNNNIDAGALQYIYY